MKRFFVALLAVAIVLILGHQAMVWDEQGSAPLFDLIGQAYEWVQAFIAGLRDWDLS